MIRALGHVSEDMTGDKHFQIQVEDRSWRNQVPPKIDELRGSMTLSLGEILAKTAVLTRPPTVRGFHLSDYWACLRYGPAFAPGNSFRLREEWEDIDPHQKTILSDEIGVGVTCLLLQRALGLGPIVPTLHFLKAIEPDRFRLGRTNRVGSQKSPDYVGWRDESSKITVIECKGTQTKGNLASAMDGGKEQKENLEPRPGGTIEHSLVAGLYIPRHSHSGPAEVRIADPEPNDDLLRIVESTGLSIQQTAIGQLWLAKMFALLELDREANLLAETPAAELDKVTAEIQTSLEPYREKGLSHVVEFRRALAGREGSMYIPRRFTVFARPGVVSEISEASSLTEYLLKRGQEGDGGWSTEQSETTTSVRLPMGFEATLEMEMPIETESPEPDLDRGRRS